MPLLRIQRYKSQSGVVVVNDYFITEGSYDADNDSIVLELDPSLFPSLGNYAIIRTTGLISHLATPIGPTATWTSAHPSGWSVSAPLFGNANIGGTPYNVIYVTVSA
jgi:hypothetical protein